MNDFLIPAERGPGGGGSGGQPGFRCHRLEVFNWGTFHEKVWKLVPGGDNALLTGDIGSGKSTLVDAITTLLVPPQKVSYNKAAGADARERSLRSYVLGHYKSERTDAGTATRPVSLRDHNSYSVLLGHFRNVGLDQDVTLAQVFWIRDPSAPPARLYVLSDRPLSIAEDFAGFGSDLAELRKRLKNAPGIDLFDRFPPYGAGFRRRFGIQTEQALELFHQTVSMKSVGNLTDFVRHHMLEPFDAEAQISALIKHFDDLTHAHEAVRKAKAQVAFLSPLVQDSDQHDRLFREGEHLRACRDGLESWFSERKLSLLGERSGELSRRIEALAVAILEKEQHRKDLGSRRDDIRQAIGASGGDRLARIREEIVRKETDKAERRKRFDRYADIGLRLGFPEVRDAGSFLENRRQGEREREKTESALARVQNALTEEEVRLRQVSLEEATLEAEIDSLRRRRTNIPSSMLALRERIVADTGILSEHLPFAGELISVREKERDWEGAAERLLRVFGLSLLVADRHYPVVSGWVDRAHLGGRLVYYRVREDARTDLPTLDPLSLASKLDVRPDSPFASWIASVLSRRFNYICCADLDRFRRERQAVTLKGQIKQDGERHEKDDRYRIDDRTRYILGWSNEAKIRALERSSGDLGRRREEMESRIGAFRKEKKALEETRRLLDQMEMFVQFSELDWGTLALEIESLQEERRRIEADSDVLKALETELEEVERNLVRAESDWAALGNERAVASDQLSGIAREIRRAEGVLARASIDDRKVLFPRIGVLWEESPVPGPLDLESFEEKKGTLEKWLSSRIEEGDRATGRVREALVRRMQEYIHLYPLETREVSARMESVQEFREMLVHLEADDLPRFESRFKELLNENTIREVANFQSRLHRERQTIRDRVAVINGSLKGIDYNTSRYIRLEADTCPDPEVRDFQQELRACTEGVLTGSGDAVYSEAKFLQVQRIIERFQGRPGSADMDRRWTSKVTDVRNWFVFSASERWREDDREYEHYTDSGGKSGGQKEKLAYTVLAASLAYQFGLEGGTSRFRTFRFVVIDEAFGRGSDESARYGLELFGRLGLQLLVVTPLQKIHIIEPYVSSVGFVHNEDGRLSRVRTITIEEYRAGKRGEKEKA
ncbi:MAG: ATP-dependent exonuclease SbcCD, C subunit-like protein [Nitrospirae bacterium]|nr:ATP-dependent exonuclease SbcCD, C subunit-like protein [Nitrospirota bacterium]